MCLKSSFGALIAGFLVIAVFGYADAHSIPTPTQLAELVSTDGSSRLREKHLQTILSQSASARLKSIVIEAPDGRLLSGIEIELSKVDGSRKLYLEEALLPGLVEELSKLNPIYPCEAGKFCTIGIARCGGRNAEPQAYCVAYNYGSREMPDGVMIRVPDESFLFPGVEPEAFVRAVGRYGQDGGGT